MTKPGKIKHLKKRPLDGPADERTLFEAVMRDVRPLKRRQSRHAIGTAKLSAKMEIAAKPKPKTTARLTTTPTHRPTVSPSVHAKPSGGLDKRSAKRLRRGQMSIDGRLDLHGHTQADAHRAAHAFVAAGYRSGKRCVLIITGKGGARDNIESSFMPDRDSGVLRRNLPRWLGEASVRHMVLRIESARPQHGGEGAYYVLLRRKR